MGWGPYGDIVKNDEGRNNALNAIFQLLDDWGLGALRTAITNSLQKKHGTKEDYTDIIESIMKKARSMRDEALKIDTSGKVVPTDVLDDLQAKLQGLYTMKTSPTTKHVIQARGNELNSAHKKAKADYERALTAEDKRRQSQLNKQTKLLNAADEYESLAMAKANQYQDIGSYSRATRSSDVVKLRSDIDELSK